MDRRIANRPYNGLPDHGLPDPAGVGDIRPESVPPEVVTVTMKFGQVPVTNVIVPIGQPAGVALVFVNLQVEAAGKLPQDSVNGTVEVAGIPVSIIGTVKGVPAFTVELV